MSKYNPEKIEKKWQRRWEEGDIYETKDDIEGKKNYMLLTEFPYPSGNLHIGHWFAFAVPDILARFLRLKGKNVMYPMGFDAFGLPAENAAIKRGLNPRDWTQDNIRHMIEQFRTMGGSFDWSRMVSTIDPAYYEWTQWIFLKMFQKGLAYREEVTVNWCPSCKTVLANEQVTNSGSCERCDTEVVQKKLKQWLYKITDYAERLINDLVDLDWPESTKLAQKNWIGKSQGADVYFLVEGSEKKIVVFTTRIDTIFSGTFVILAPEHPLVEEITVPERKKEVEEYIKNTAKKTELERTAAEPDKTGVFTGAYAVNPATGEKIQVWISDFVLANYGAGAVFADAHDKRDFDMAKKYGLPLKVSIRPQDGELWEKIQKLEECFEEEGLLVNSEQFDGLNSIEARPKIIAWLEKKGLAREKVNYKLHDWVISRQRYWGVPIPVVHCEKCGIIPWPEDKLPVKLPELKDFLPTGEGKSPLAKAEEWVNVKCPECGGDAKRETDTMDTFVDSSWYFIRYADPKNEKEFTSMEKMKKWLPVPMYIGGAEHNTMHLLYSRFFTKVLFDLGLVHFSEPFSGRRNHGIILGPDNQKMSKSRGNVVDPDAQVKQYGADSVRMYLAFMGPYDQNASWQMQGITGTRRFLEKVWKIYDGDRIVEDKEKIKNGMCSFALRDNDSLEKRQQEKAIEEVSYMERMINKTIKKVSKDIDDFKFNTAISEMMIFINEAEKFCINKNRFEKFLILLSPFAPHLTEELWEKLGHEKSIFLEKWPEYDPKLVKDEEISLIIQINGKVRDQVKVLAGVKEEEARELALKRDKVIKYTQGKNIRKTIFVENRLINFVV